MTRLEFAAATGVTARTLENIEYLEVAKPSRRTLGKLANYFAVTVEELLEGKVRR